MYVAAMPRSQAEEIERRYIAPPAQSAPLSCKRRGRESKFIAAVIDSSHGRDWSRALL
ncbi:MAG: hypothetical protein OJF58_003054 [Enhydrobacter sp.]|nr:MAG: hypothetical protein OJF58_003054 [Enhydrobacter sp.]